MVAEPPLPDTRQATALPHRLSLGFAPALLMVGGRLKGFTSPPGWTLAPLRSASGGGGPLTRPPPAEGSTAEPTMAALSHTIRLQQLSWQTLVSWTPESGPG